MRSNDILKESKTACYLRPKKNNLHSILRRNYMRCGLRCWSLLVICVLVSVAGFCAGNTLASKEVVVYTSLDKVFSEPVLQEFEKQTGIKVKAVYDSEATKTTGLVNRLIAEKKAPQGDVFWNSKTCRTIILKQKGVLASYKSPLASK
jgi:iron(III) transport system substrate-binding protein